MFVLLKDVFRKLRKAMAVRRHAERDADSQAVNLGNNDIESQVQRRNIPLGSGNAGELGCGVPMSYNNNVGGMGGRVPPSYNNNVGGMGGILPSYNQNASGIGGVAPSYNYHAGGIGGAAPSYSYNVVGPVEGSSWHPGRDGRVICPAAPAGGSILAPPATRGSTLAPATSGSSGSWQHHRAGTGSGCSAGPAIGSGEVRIDIPEMDEGDSSMAGQGQGRAAQQRTPPSLLLTTQKRS